MNNTTPYTVYSGAPQSRPAVAPPPFRSSRAALDVDSRSLGTKLAHGWLKSLKARLLINNLFDRDVILLKSAKATAARSIRSPAPTTRSRAGRVLHRVGRILIQPTFSYARRSFLVALVCLAFVAAPLWRRRHIRLSHPRQIDPAPARATAGRGSAEDAADLENHVPLYSARTPAEEAHGRDENKLTIFHFARRSDRVCRRQVAEDRGVFKQRRPRPRR